MNRWEQQRLDQRERAQEPCGVDGCKYCVEVSGGLVAFLDRWNALTANLREKGQGKR